MLYLICECGYVKDRDKRILCEIDDKTCDYAYKCELGYWRQHKDAEHCQKAIDAMKEA